MCRSTDTSRNSPKVTHFCLNLLKRAPKMPSSCLCCKIKLSYETGAFLSLSECHLHLEILHLFSLTSVPFSSVSSSLSLSACYSCCHPHRTSEKCADSGCWATIPYYWSFKWKPSSPWLAGFQWGGVAAMLYDHMSLCTSFVQINMSSGCLHILTFSSEWKERLP